MKVNHFNPYSPENFKFKPLDKETKAKAEGVIHDVLDIKDKLISFDNNKTPQPPPMGVIIENSMRGIDINTKKGQVEIYNTTIAPEQDVTGGIINYDVKTGDLKSLNADLVKDSFKSIGDGYKHFDYIQIDDGGFFKKNVETEIYREFDGKTGIEQEVIVDKKSGAIAYFERDHRKP
ncbi:MAG: hypothetical protein ABRQ38_07460 [Candidatus Eremiobacterota bacterium]